MVALAATVAATAAAGTLSYSGPKCVSFALSGTPPNQQLTCVGAGGGGSPPTCVPTVQPSAPLAGKSTTISANCSNQPLPNGYTWTGPGCAGQTGSTCTVTKAKPGTLAFTVSGSNTTGTGTPAPISVTWR